MFWQIVCLNVALVTVVMCGGSTNESPGFFLKVAKNVPRLGRRAGADAVHHTKRAAFQVADGSTIDEQRPATWFERLVQPAKRVLTATRHSQTDDSLTAAAAASYRKVQPFDSSVLIDMITSAADGGRPIDDLKFVSWKDFDIALESDTELYRKLEELALGEADLLAAGHQPIEVEHFVSMDDGSPNGQYHNNGDGGMFYRVDRAAKGLEKERVEYQM